MNVALWAEIRRLAEIDKLSGRVIARRLHCSRHTVAAALQLQQPPTRTAARRASRLEPYLDQIQSLLGKYPDLSAVRIREEIARGPHGYTGSTTLVRRYLRKVRPARGRVYQEVQYQPAQAMQVDWGDCGYVQVGATRRKISVFVAVLCYSRLLYIEFTLSQRKAEFYRGLANALTFFGGSPRVLIVDNLKAAVLNGAGRSACFHPEFLALCGYFCVQPLACAARDPESKGVVEGSVRYVKHNALAGRADELTRFEDYLALAPYWRDQVANVRLQRIWCADFWRDDRHCRQSLKTSNKKIAIQRAVQLEAKLAAGSYQPPPPPVTLQQATKDYLIHLENEHRAPKTLVKYRGILATLVEFLADHQVTRLAQFTAMHFDRFRAARRPEVHRKTLYTEGVVVKQFFKWAKTRKLIAESPIADIKLNKPLLEPKGGPTLDQVDRILAATIEHDRTALAVLAFTGMRSGELRRLQPDDLDLMGNWIHIRSRQGLETKTGLSRKVPIHPRLHPLLEALPKQRRPWLFMQLAGKEATDEGRWPLNVKRLNERFLAVLKKLHLAAGRDGGYTLHSLRHFFETFTVNSGIPQRAVDTWLGHRSDKSMAAIYYKLPDEESQQFMGKVPFGKGTPAASAGQKEECA